LTKPSFASRPDPARAGTRAPVFPSYTGAEVAADCAVHIVGLSAATACIAWLIASLGTGATARQVVAFLIYCAGLIGMLAASAAYNLASPSRAKSVLRRLDHAMIFVMIAGSYTPFALTALEPRVGTALLGAVWGVALTGVALKLACFNRIERASLALYLGMGWMVLVVIRPLITALPGAVLMLLLAGGVVYSLGALVHVRDRVPFQNAIWHAMVLVAAGLHLAAITRLLMPTP